MNYSVIAEKFGLSKARAETIVKTAMAQIKDEVLNLGHCWVGRGTYFKKVEKPERPFRNPRTGEKGVAPARTMVVLKKQVA